MAATAVLCAAMVALIEPTTALAYCNPGRSPGAGFQAGAYKDGIDPWGVRADLEGYHDFVPLVYLGAQANVTVMLNDDPDNGWYWIQPGWVEANDSGNLPDGYHSFVQFQDTGPLITKSWGQAGCSGSDPVPAYGTLARYSVLKSFDSGTGRFVLDVKLAGVTCVQFTTAVVYNHAEVFAEVTNRAAQFPGDTNDHERLQTVEWKDSGGTWHNINDPTGPTNPCCTSEIGWNQITGYTDRYAVWDKKCSM